MKYKIKKGRHFSTPFKFPKIYWNKTDIKMNYVVTFSKCDYIIEDEDKYDINKLFGISYGYHHTNSDRIGWRYNEETNKIELFQYSYENKKRFARYIDEIEMNKKYYISLEVHKNKKRNIRELTITIDGKEYIFFLKYNENRFSKISYTLTPYFGGNKKAPKDMFIDIVNI